ncbi:MAG: ABC transporter ATP-binding protein [Eubacterium sp.]
MLKIFNKFFNFCGKVNKGKFYKSLVLGVFFAIMEAMKIPAIMLLLDGAMKQDVTPALIWESFGIILASVIIGSIIKYRITMLQCEAGYYTTAGKRIEIAEHMRYLPMGYFNKNSLGQITSVTTNTMEQMADVATRVVMMTTQGILTTLIITVMILFFDWRIGLVAVAGIVLFLVVNSVLQKRSQVLAPIKTASDTDVVEKVLEYVQGISEVRGYNLTGKTSEKLNTAIDENRHINTEMELKFVPLMQIQNGIIKLAGVVMTLLSIYFYLQGSMVLLNCIGMIICSFIVLDSLGTAGNYSSLLRVVDIGVDKVQVILDLPEMDIDGKEITPKNYDVDIKNIDFYYDKNLSSDKSKIIDDVSVHIPERTTTAIVGPSGGGKTTLCHLIARFWDVDRGSISLGGENVRNYSMDSLMKNFSFVFQNVYLFQDTIANNIRFGQEDAPMEKVIEAAKKACCHDFIMALPDGYETVIGEGGASLSGGEKQRISIARAIMKDSPIIILDEATANVDPENEKELMEAINALTKEKTIFMIAHRLKTVRNADKILVLDHGKIVQQGRHRELMQQEGIYKRFVESRELAASWKL